MKISIAFAVCFCAWAQSDVERPRLGKMVDANGSVRSVYGIAASVTLGDAEATGVLSSACSSTLCLAKTDAGIVSALGTVAAPRGPAMFAFDGATAYIWFPESSQLAQWTNGTLSTLGNPASRSVLTAPASRGSIYLDESPRLEMEPRPSGAVSAGVFTQTRNGGDDVLSIGVKSGAMQFVVRRPTGIWIVNQDGSVAGALPRAIGAVMLIPGGAVYATGAGIAIHDLEIPLDGVTGFSWMSGSYLQVRARGINYALRIDPGRETLFQLPGVQQ